MNSSGGAAKKNPAKTLLLASCWQTGALRPHPAGMEQRLEVYLLVSVSDGVCQELYLLMCKNQNNKNVSKLNNQLIITVQLQQAADPADN